MKTWKQQTFSLVGAVTAIFAVVLIGCPASDDGKETPVHVHEWGDWQVTTPATCTAAGEETRVCALDATHKETQAIAALGHNYQWVTTTAATCTTEGLETGTCTHDGSTTTRPIAIDPTAHQWGAWTQTKAATYTEEGEDTRTCALDAMHKETCPIPRIPFTSVANLGTWLTSQSNNTADTPYTIALNVNNEDDFASLRTTLNTAPDKYVYLDLSGSTITTIPDIAFYDNSTSPATSCATLTGIILPDNVTSIGDRAFQSCTSLTSVTLPNSVTSIGLFAFYNNTSLASVTIGNNVTSIGRAAFASCTSLTVINVDPGNSVYTEENDILYNKDKTVLILYPAGKTDSTFIIPSNITSIGIRAFQGCINLTGVTIPKSVTSIEDYVFISCTSLTSVTIGNDVTNIGYGAFFNCNSLTSVIIPKSVISIGGNAFRECSSVTFEGTITSDNLGSILSGGTTITSPFNGDLRDKYLAANGGIGTYTTTAPVGENSVWTKQN
jgi:hypothetical protein